MKNDKNKLMSRERNFLSGFALVAILVFIFGFTPGKAEASVAGYTAEKISQNYGSLTLVPGRAVTFEVSFKNTGTVTWYNNNSRYISLYADGAGKLFRHKYWYTAEQPGKMSEAEVPPGGVAHLRFALQAPELLGFYTIKLKLAAENLTWIPGGVLEIPVSVTNNPASGTTVPAPSGTVTAAAENFQALKLIQSSQTVALGGGGKNNFNVGFKNIGKASWETSGTNLVKICATTAVPTEAFRDSNWLTTSCPAAVSAPTPVGQIGYFSFSLVGNLGGDYNPTFVLMNNDKTISGGEIILPIKISGTVEAPIITPAPETQTEESTIRVGLYNTTTAETIRANTAFEIRDAENNLIFTVPSGATATVAFNFTGKTYSAALDGEIRDNLSYLRFLAPDLNTIFEITSFEDRPAWNTSLNDNKFRGNLELRWSEDREKLYMINELSLEAYLKGLAETSNNNPAEYHKALAVAARTYAQYNINIGGKHPAGYFHLNASSYDQVYRGYNSEIRLPNFVKAVEDTRGIVVIYDNEVVVTPYFSQSDGRTRAWEEVWWGTGKPWLVSKPDPNCAGMNLFGHGVGLSARGARGMALSGSTFEQILKYYYTGVELKKIY